MLYPSILHTIGRTPLVQLHTVSANPNVKVYAKLEGQNPGGSIKDRVALNLINIAEKKGELTRAKTILEATSGNTGIGLAMIAANKGYKITLTMSADMSPERQKILRAYGAELILTEPSEGTDGAIRKAREIFVKNPQKYWMSDQYGNPANPETHFKSTAQEIIEDLPEIDILIAGIGTSGTLMGMSKKLKTYNPKIKIIAVEPKPQHRLPGLKNLQEAIVPKIFQVDKIDAKIQVEDEDAIVAMRKIIRHEGLFVGISSGAALHIARQESQKIASANIVVILPDRGEKYLSTEVFI